MAAASTESGLAKLLARRSALEARERARPELAGRLRELRAWQAARLARTYADLREEPRFRAAVEFFLSDVYGPQDLTGRNRNLAQALTFLQPLLPQAALRVLQQSIELDALTAELDSAMAERLPTGSLSDAAYAGAYRTVGATEARARQLDLLVCVVADLERISRHAWIGLVLLGARLPAQAAGFGALQDFLERGFFAFGRMRGAEELLRIFREREQRFMQAVLEDPIAQGKPALNGCMVRSS